MSERPEGVPENAEPQTWWVAVAGEHMHIYTPGGFFFARCTVDSAEYHLIPLPPRTDPWGLGLTEEECRELVDRERSVPGACPPWEVKLAEALRPVVAEWDEEDGR